MQHKLCHSESQITKLKGMLDRVSDRFTNWKSKYDQLKIMDDDCHVEKEDEFFKKLNEEIASLEENLDLWETVNEVMATSNEVVTFEKGKYTDDVRTCCFELSSLNVGVNNIKPVINTVLKNIAHKKVGRLPAKSILCDMMVECLTITQAQLGEELVKSGARQSDPPNRWYHKIWERICNI